MIQRIQSIYLLAVVALQASATALSFLSFTNTSRPFTLYSCGVRLDGTSEYTNSYLLLLLLSLVSLIAGASIFLFKNRKLQIKLNRLNTILVLAQILYVGYSFYQLTNIPNVHEITLGSGFYLSIFTLIPLMLAIRAIQKDENLIKSVDRIR